MLDAYRVRICAPAMIRALVIGNHLVDEPVAVDDIMRRYLSTARTLIHESIDRSIQRSFGAMDHDHVDACAIPRRSVRALNEFFNRRLFVVVTAAVCV